MANVPIYFEQGGQTLVVDTGGTLDTTNGTVTLGPVAVGVDGIETANLQDDCVTTAKIDDAAVTTAKMALVSVDDTILADDAVTTDKILDANVTKAKINMFISAEQTGTQTMIAHGLGADPTAANVIVAATDTSGTDTPGVYDVAIATDATNISVTVTGGALVYKVLAFAP